ncbi:MAG: hypothetical protein UY16_C0036G0003 [Candidatus Gottesmanbacteria bacterium GW2011_GWA2_47_9]|uniref:Uncharacterized protein n=1 Tax=Candidatus Gottesmanbacteria bacterium GW2011_GWA2_47_9 TaxID=1618445 RepID=A0A0G1TZB3_9BACT|nr:MAG: hypothetical protein UY16_C0036G0003 [Candidatus Gottesmanbacteria bacterium GW2011_GWA2_47_9]KKU97665.1 MAG: hypothetical protein UY30_C0001G0011 [Parcubacteria group bacterium GW2011_GWB1_48_6]
MRLHFKKSLLEIRSKNMLFIPGSDTSGRKIGDSPMNQFALILATTAAGQKLPFSLGITFAVIMLVLVGGTLLFINYKSKET